MSVFKILDLLRSTDTAVLSSTAVHVERKLLNLEYSSTKFSRSTIPSLKHVSLRRLGLRWPAAAAAAAAAARRARGGVDLNLNLVGSTDDPWIHVPRVLYFFF
eukprot:SAG31_NODE_776_length_12175_cov_9.349122_6_plen_103_part_00